MSLQMAYFAPMAVLSQLPLFFGGRKEASRKLSFEWTIFILIGHYSSSKPNQFPTTDLCDIATKFFPNRLTHLLTQNIRFWTLNKWFRPKFMEKRRCSMHCKSVSMNYILKPQDFSSRFIVPFIKWKKHTLKFNECT